MGWLYEQFFRRDEEATEPVEDASHIVAFGNMSEYERLMEWLQAEAERPVPMGDHLMLAAGVARSNTLREVRNHLKVRLRNAVALMQRHREDQSNA
jgi:hypothetical protein